MPSLHSQLSEIDSLAKRKRYLRDLIAKEHQKREEAWKKSTEKIVDWTDKLKQIENTELLLQQQSSQQGQLQSNGSANDSTPQHAHANDNTSHHPEVSSDDYFASTSDEDGPPGFSDSVHSSSARSPAQNGTPPLSMSNNAQSRNVFSRLGQSPSVQQQSKLPQPGTSNPASNHNHPPGFATPPSSTAQSKSHDQDLPPGFPAAAGPSSAQQPSRRSGMRSDQPQYAASAQASSSLSSHQPTPASASQYPEGPPGFAGLPAHLARRLAPSPDHQQPLATNHKQARALPQSTDQSKRSGPSSRQASAQELPSASAGEGNLAATTDRLQRASEEASADHSDLPGHHLGPLPSPQGFVRPPEHAATTADAPVGSGRQTPAMDRADSHPSNADVQGNAEFPGLSFGIKGLDQHQRWSSMDDSEDFPTLGGPPGDLPGPKPAGAWGKGAGHLAGSLRQQQQVSNVASSLAASVQPTQPPTVHIERVELSAGLRVPGDDASDGVRKKRARKHEFEKWERIKGGANVNIVQGLELHDNVLSPAEQANMVNIIEDWVVQGKQGKLRGRTFSAPRKWARGKGRITCQFGCCYNYAIDSEGRNPGIVAEEVVEKMPPVLVSLCKRLVRWGILPKHKEPDTAIVNVYDVDDCIPPHIDHHDFDRPFCTISLLSQQNIMFGSKIISRGPGDFLCDYEIPLPVGSCLVLKGNGADVAQHCVPPVSARRISITLRRMQEVHARRVVAMAERVHAGLSVDLERPPAHPQRISADDAYDMDERKVPSSGRRR